MCSTMIRGRRPRLQGIVDVDHAPEGGRTEAGDAIFTSPVVTDGRVYVVGGSGTAFAFDAQTLEQKWGFTSDSANSNCNNLSSPAFSTLER
ncbi:MAG TPA: hypothetical protein EYQ50_21145 [Verrucomicrobiales bacterium]|nr:hypothetical protein [Verrucomicrobiales bacterium]